MSNLYNPRFKIFFECDPSVQAAIGRFDGYSLVLDALADARDREEGDEIRFVYSNQGSWRDCVNYLQRCVGEAV